MDPQITGRTEITEPIRNYVLSKFNKLERHFGNISSAHFVLNSEAGDFKVEANVHVPGHEVFVKKTDSNMYAAIDLLMDKLDTQLSKIKQKTQNHHHPSHHNEVNQLHQKLNDEIEDQNS